MSDKMLNFGRNCPRIGMCNEGAYAHPPTKYEMILAYLRWMRRNMRSGSFFNPIDLP